MAAFRLVEVQRLSHGVEHALGHALQISSLHAGVVVDTHPASIATSSRRSPVTRRLAP